MMQVLTLRHKEHKDNLHLIGGKEASMQIMETLKTLNSSLKLFLDLALILLKLSLEQWVGLVNKEMEDQWNKKFNMDNLPL